MNNVAMPDGRVLGVSRKPGAGGLWVVAVKGERTRYKTRGLEARPGRREMQWALEEYARQNRLPVGDF